MKKDLLLLVLLVLPWFSYCQVLTIDGGILFGISKYEGDMTPDRFSENVRNINPSVGIFSRINFSRQFSARWTTLFTSLSGNDNNSNGNRQRLLQFKTKLIETSVMAEWNITRRSKSGAEDIYPYLSLGLGAFYFNPTTDFDNQEIKLQPLGTEGQGLSGYPSRYHRVQPMIPFGVGLKIKIENFGQMGIEASFRKTFSDYIDDVSGTEVNYLDLLNANRLLAAQISRPRIDPNDPDPEEIVYIRGNSPKDWYYFVNFSLSVPIATIYRKKWGKCPRM